MRKAGPNLARAAVAVIALWLSAIPAGAPSAEDQRTDWNRPVAPYRIAGNVYYVGVKGIATYLIATPKGHILVDGGYEETAPRILASLKALGFQARDVKYLVITHAHNDHAGGLAALKAATGAQLLALQVERKALEEGVHEGEYDYGVGRFTPVRVDRVIRDGEVIRLGGSALMAHWTPGHTKGCTSFTLPLVEAGRPHTALFHCSSTPGGNRLVGNRVFPEIVSAYRQSFRTFRSLRTDILLPNHPGLANLEEKRARVRAGAPNPFIDAGELPRFMDTWERNFEAELARQREGRQR